MGAYADLRVRGYSDKEITEHLQEKGFSTSEIDSARILYDHQNNYSLRPDGSIESVTLNIPDTAINLGKDILNYLGYGKAIKEGFEESNVGMLATGELPKESTTKFTKGQELAKNITSVVSDSPIYAVGSVPGVALKNPTLASAGAFGAEDAVREIIIQTYKNGEVSNWNEVLKKIVIGGMVGATTSKVGALTKTGLGKVAEKTGISKVAKENLSSKTYEKVSETSGEISQIVGNIIGLTTSSTALNEKRLPTLKDFNDSAVVLLSLYGLNRGVSGIYNSYRNKRVLRKANNTQNITQTVTDSLMDIYRETGEEPKSVLNRAVNDEQVMQDILVPKEKPAKVGEVMTENNYMEIEPNPEIKYPNDTININGKEKSSLNSKGEYIQNTDIGLANFYNWFGDSNLVDKQGRPIPVYHGTRQHNIKEFKTPYGDGLIFFSFEKEFADRWSKNAIRTKEQEQIIRDIDSREMDFRGTLYDKYKEKYGEKWYEDEKIFKEFEKEKKQWRDKEEEKAGISPITMPVYLKVKKTFYPDKDWEKVLPEVIKSNGFKEEDTKISTPEEIAKAEKIYKEKLNALRKEYESKNKDDEWDKKGTELFHELQAVRDRGQNFKHHLERIKKGSWIYFEHKDVMDKIRELGYDSIVLREVDGKDYSTIAVFQDNNQIKSTKNRGTYDESNNIFKSEIESKESRDIDNPLAKLPQDVQDIATRLPSHEIDKAVYFFDKKTGRNVVITGRGNLVFKYSTGDDGQVRIDGIYKKADAINDFGSYDVYDVARGWGNKDIYDEKTQTYNVSKSDIKPKYLTEIEQHREKSTVHMGEKVVLNVGDNPEYKGKIVKMTDIVKKLSKDLGLPLHKGRMRNKESVRGWIKPISKELRIRSHNDISVASHELGHYLESVIFGKMDSKDLKPYEEELSKIATKGSPTAEGWAEFVSYFVTNPEYIKERVPNFYKKFNELMPIKAPETYKDLLEAQSLLKEWSDMPSNKRIESLISFSERTDTPDVARMKEDFYTNYVDDLFPIKVMQDNVNKGKELPISQDAYKLARLHRGVRGKANSFIINGTFGFDLKPKGESLRKIMKDLNEKERKEFSTYLVAEHALELNRKGILTGIDSRDAEFTIKKYKGKYFDRAKRIYNYEDSILDYAVEGGFIDFSVALNFKKMYPKYVPFLRELPKESGKKQTTKKDPFQYLRGSDLEILDPIYSIIKKTYDVITVVDGNNIKRQLVSGLSGKEGSGRYINRVPKKLEKTTIGEDSILLKEKKDGMLTGNEIQLSDPMTGDVLGLYSLMGDNIWKQTNKLSNDEFSVRNGSDVVIYETDPEFAKLLNNFGEKEYGTMINIFGKFTDTLRKGATLDVGFMEKNFIRDTFEAMVNSKNFFVPVVDSVLGAFDLVNNKELRRKAQRAGASQATFVSQNNRKKIEKQYKNFEKSGYTERVWNRVKSPLETLGDISEFIENATRMAEFKKSYNKYLEKGMSEKDAQLQAAFDARELTIDFARIGLKVRAINRVNAFFNAQIQGTDKMFRNFKNYPVKTISSLAALGMISSFFAVGATNSELEDLSDAIKNTHWVYKINGAIKKIPVPQNYIPFHMFINKLFETDPNLKESILEQLTSDMNPQEMLADILYEGMVDLTPDAVVPIIEAYANKKSYFDRPIVPMSLERRLPIYQQNEFTSGTAKAIAKVFDDLGFSNSKAASPMIIDNFISKWTGSVGRTAVRLIDAGSEKMGLSEKVEDVFAYEKNPFFRGFRVAYSSYNFEPYDKFMKESGTIEKKVNSLKYALKQNHLSKTLGRGQAYETNITEQELTQYRDVLIARNAILQLGKELDNIYKDKSEERMPLEDRQKLAHDLVKRQVQIAKMGLKLIDRINKSH